MQHIQKGGNGVARRLANIGLLHKSVVEERDGVLFLLIGVAASLAALGLLSCRCAGDVESHLHHLVFPGCGLFPVLLRCAILSVGLGTVVYSELDGDFVATRQVGVGDLRVGNLKGWSVLDVERELRLSEFGLAPVPSSEGVLLVLEVRAVPVLEELVEALVVLQLSASSAKPHLGLPYLLLEAIELDDSRCPLKNLDFVAFRCSTPLRTADVALIEGKGLTASRGLPTQACLGEPAFSALLGQVQEDVVEALAVVLVSLFSKPKLPMDDLTLPP